MGWGIVRRFKDLYREEHPPLDGCGLADGLGRYDGTMDPSPDSPWPKDDALLTAAGAPSEVNPYAPPLDAGQPGEGPPGEEPRHNPYAALGSQDFCLLLAGTFLAIISEQMLAVAIGWELWERTHSELALAMIGLVEVVPVVLLALPAGQAVDRLPRKWIGVAAMAILVGSSLGLAVLSHTTGPLLLVYLCLFFMGVARAFQSPALSAVLSQVVPPEHFNNAATWNSSAWQSSACIGPLLGGTLIWLCRGATPVYFLSAGGLLIVAIMLACLQLRPVARMKEPLTFESLIAGLRFIWRTKVMLAAISLDMFAVLLGGAVALMPVFATDILHVGPTGLAALRAAPAFGAVIAAIVIAHLPPFKRAGLTLLAVVIGFGLVTIIFGLSTSFPLSIAMLVLLGALDNVSVVIRSTLLLTRTPDEMRGRVNAVHYVFVGISNELGAFESGAAAAVMGTVPATVAGGIGTIVVVGLIAVIWPEIRRLGKLTGEGSASNQIE